MSDSNKNDYQKPDSSADSAQQSGSPSSSETEQSASGKSESGAKAARKSAPTAKVLDDISRGTSGKKAASGSSRARRKPGAAAQFLTLFIILLPLLAAIAFLGWQQWTLRQSLTSLSQQNQQMQSTLAGQRSVIADLQQRPEPEVPEPVVDDNDAAAIAQLNQNLEQATQTLNASLRQTNQTLNNEINRLQQQLADLQNQRAGDPAEPDFNWKVFEAEYLVNQAAQKLQLEADVSTAISLLEQADAALLASGHSEAFAVRQILGEDLARLRNVETVDRDGIYLRLASLGNSVGDLDLLQSMREEFEARQARESQPVTPAVEDSGMWNSALGFLNEVFVWRRWDERPEAVLAPGQETVIKLNLRLFIKQAQLALLVRDQQQYRQSLEDTRSWLQRYAVTDSASGRNFSTEIGELLNLDIAPELPALNASLTRTRQLADSER